MRVTPSYVLWVAIVGHSSGSHEVNRRTGTVTCSSRRSNWRATGTRISDQEDIPSSDLTVRELEHDPFEIVDFSINNGGP